MKKKILVTGGSGFLGSALLQYLRPDYEVFSIDLQDNLDLFTIDNTKFQEIMPNLILSNEEKENFRKTVFKIIDRRNTMMHDNVRVNLEDIIEDLDELIKINEISEKTKMILIQLYNYYCKN